MLSINSKFLTDFGTYWTFPWSIFLNIHKSQKCFQIKTLSMITFRTPCWSLYQSPSKWIFQIDFNLLNFQIIFFFIFQICEIILNKVISIVGGIQNRMIELINSVFLYKINSKDKCEVVFDFLRIWLIYP